MTWYRADRVRYGALDKGGAVRFYDEKLWWAALRGRLQQSKLSPIIYIHGYNNDNRIALERAAAIRIAVGADHEVISFTWPSYGSVSKYGWDEANAEWATRDARDFLRCISKTRNDLVIVAHSMGNRLALALLADKSAPYARHVTRLVMASPDIDRSEAVSELQAGLGLTVTLYGSTRDQALAASWRWHGYARAGDLSSWVTGRKPEYTMSNLPNVNVVDTSAVTRGHLHHADFIETPEGAADLCRVVNDADVIKGRAPDRPGRWRLARKHVGDSCEEQGRAAFQFLSQKR